MLKVVVISFFVAVFWPITSVGEVSQHEPTIRDLDILIGTWLYVDESTDLAGFDYRETGFTECAYALDAAYIRCDGESVYNGKSSTFVEYLNCNGFTGGFQRVAMLGNHTAIATFTLEIS